MYQFPNRAEKQAIRNYSRFYGVSRRTALEQWATWRLYGGDDGALRLHFSYMVRATRAA